MGRGVGGGKERGLWHLLRGAERTRLVWNLQHISDSRRFHFYSHVGGVGEGEEEENPAGLNDPYLYIARLTHLSIRL